MSTLPVIAELMASYLAEGNIREARNMAYQAAAKLGGDRGQRIHKALEANKASNFKFKHWKAVNELRTPWTPANVTKALSLWLLEAQHSVALAAAGEKVLPLLLLGETRCGKTSSLCSLAGSLGLAVQRLSLGSVQGSFLGEASRKIEEAFSEARLVADNTLWTIDEIDAVSYRRVGDSAAGQERASGVATFLTEIESLPPGVMLAATSNVDELIDPAVLARFTVVRFPKWVDLSCEERDAFGDSHGSFSAGPDSRSYSEVVQKARQERVARVIETAKKEAA